MKTFKGTIHIQRRDMLKVTTNFRIGAIGLPEALLELFRREGQRGAIMGFSITDVTLKKARAEWLKKEHRNG